MRTVICTCIAGLCLLILTMDAWAQMAIEFRVGHGLTQSIAPSTSDLRRSGKLSDELFASFMRAGERRVKTESVEAVRAACLKLMEDESTPDNIKRWAELRYIENHSGSREKLVTLVRNWIEENPDEEEFILALCNFVIKVYAHNLGRLTSKEILEERIPIVDEFMNYYFKFDIPCNLNVVESLIELHNTLRRLYDSALTDIQRNRPEFTDEATKRAWLISVAEQDLEAIAYARRPVELARYYLDSYLQNPEVCLEKCPDRPDEAQFHIMSEEELLAYRLASRACMRLKQAEDFFQRAEGVLSPENPLVLRKVNYLESLRNPPERIEEPEPDYSRAHFESELRRAREHIRDNPDDPHLEFYKVQSDIVEWHLKQDGDPDPQAIFDEINAYLRVHDIAPDWWPVPELR